MSRFILLQQHASQEAPGGRPRGGHRCHDGVMVLLMIIHVDSRVLLMIVAVVLVLSVLQERYL